MMFGLVLFLVVFAFSYILPPEWGPIPVRLLIPVLLWAAISLGVRACVLFYIVILVATVVVTSYLGLGPLARFGRDFTNEQVWIFLMVTGGVPMAVAAVVQQRDEAREQHRLEAAERSRVERAQSISMERDRILREMHDGIGGQLTSILSMVQRGAATNEEISEALRRALDDMRIMIDALEASDVGLSIMIGRLRARLDPVLRRNGLRASWKIEAPEALDAIDPTQSLHVLRIIQESIANVVQHAHATTIEIRAFVTDPGSQILAVEISDNGIGPEPESMGSGRGIGNMKTRAQALGADLRFEIREAGYAVLLLIPVSTPG
jgi:signal transduction histidine kinase